MSKTEHSPERCFGLDFNLTKCLTLYFELPCLSFEIVKCCSMFKFGAMYSQIFHCFYATTLLRNNGHLHYRLNFDLNKSRQKFHHSLKEHHKISNIPKFRCEML